MRTVLLTGHSRGIGKAIQNALLEAGHTVIGVSRNSIPEQENLHQYTADLSQPSNLVRLLKPRITEHGIDSLICNAGAGLIGSLENFSAAQIEDNLNLNLISHIQMTRLMLPELKRRSRSDIIFIGSESALQGGRYGTVYSASKFGLRGFAQALRHECAGANCHVGIINPGSVRTDFFDSLSFEPGDSDAHALDPTAVADATLKLLHSPDNAVIEEININPLQRVVKKKSQR